MHAEQDAAPAAPPAPQPQREHASTSPSWLTRARSYASVVVRHTTRHTGVGIVCAVAYFDPGNWGVDLQAGSQFGYTLLFVVLLAGLFAIFLQTQASRLGCVTGLDLASHCRILLYDRPKHKRLYRWGLLYPLYALSEIAIISTDLAELLGSAIALCLLFPALPLWAGVLLTASDVLLLLALRDPIRGQPVRVFELLIAVLVFIVLICMAVIITKARVHWGDAFLGFVPSKTIFRSDALYTSIGIIGATVMPHSLFLGSALATQDRVSPARPKEMPSALSTMDSTLSTDSETTLSASISSTPRDMRARIVSSLRRHLRVLPVAGLGTDLKSHAEHENRPLTFVRAHLYHGIVDMVISLLGLAVVINSLILILSSASFFDGDNGSADRASIFDAYALLESSVGKAGAILFALALLASGQSSSIIATLAGQIVSEGFIRWRLSPVMRRLCTRCLGLIPALVVAAGVGREGIDALLVVSQVVLSIVLPFIVFPLLWLTSSKSVMAVKKPLELVSVSPTALGPSQQTATTHSEPQAESQVETVDFSIGKATIVFGYAIWLVIVAANVYAIVGLGLGED